MGNGRDTMFWHKRWVGDGILRNQFPLLYQVSLNKDAKMSDMGVWRNNASEGEMAAYSHLNTVSSCLLQQHGHTSF